jgi:hypothetical protein
LSKEKVMSEKLKEGKAAAKAWAEAKAEMKK